MKVFCKKSIKPEFKKGIFYNVSEEGSDRNSYFVLSARYYGLRFNLKAKSSYSKLNFSDYFITETELRKQKLNKILKNESTM